LVNTIVRLAQDFVGANNLNLLLPIGQFGTRSTGGEDCASARYIYTALNPLTRWIFPRADDSVLKYLEEDNVRIEPQWYCPVIPMILVNGCEGIGTGWCTKVLPYNPKEIIRNVLRMIDGKSPQKMLPFYRNFTGTVRETSDRKFEISGVCTLKSSRRNARSLQVEVSELPVGIWTQKYKEKVLDVLSRNNIITNYKELHTEDSVKFLLEIPKGTPNGLCSNNAAVSADERKQKLRKALKLDSVVGTSTMVLFDERNTLRKFDAIEEIFEVFFEVRRRKYIERREHQKRQLQAKLRFFENQYRFVEMLLNRELIIEGKSRQHIEEALRSRNFESDPLHTQQDDDVNNNNGGGGNKSSAEFGYLLDMPLIRLTSEEAKSLCERRDSKRVEMDQLEHIDWKIMWRDDLQNLLAVSGCFVKWSFL
uniref:DNA topoisomerase (ATP-hydrolyzing) n=1 Tax=Anisakis simplex TaxID=6269 RepID=A0A0M3J0U2_ANISI